MLRHYTLQAHLAGVREHGGTIGFDVLVEPEARTSLDQDGLERGLAHFQRLAPQVVAAQLDQVEGIEEYGRIMPPMPDAVEVRHAVLVAAHGLTIDDTRARA